MSLRFALLSLLTSGPMTGYDAAKHFKESVGHLWHAPDSQIYPELRKMEAEGLLAGTLVPWGTKQATKTEYSITAAGYEALTEWQIHPLSYQLERDQTHLSAAYFEWATPEAAVRRLTEHIAHYKAVRRSAKHQITEIRERTSVTLKRRLAVTDPADEERVTAFKIFAYEGRIARANSEIAWAKRGLDLLQS